MSSIIYRNIVRIVRIELTQHSKYPEKSDFLIPKTGNSPEPFSTGLCSIL